MTLGWHRDLPDPRDLAPGSEALAGLLAALPPRRPASAPGRRRPAARADWAEYFAPVPEPGGLATSVPHACLALAQYFERRATGRRLDGSVCFLYKAARQLQGWGGDSGVSPRAALRALARFGLPPARLCPDDPADAGRPLEPIHFGFGDPHRPLRYARLDPPGADGAVVLGRVRAWLAAGFPCLFGFVVFDSVGRSAEIDVPTVFDAPIGGLAVVSVGFDDARRIRSHRGALRVRTCWGPGWGEGGYGWLPYAYVERGLAADFWTLLRPDWLASGEFGHPGAD
jgi:C1A family cysteine protease